MANAVTNEDKVEEVREALLDALTAKIEAAKSGSQSGVVRDLAEAYAWITRPGQHHGGGA